MAKVIIDGTECTCSEKVMEEILMLRSKVDAIKSLTMMIEETQYKLSEEVDKKSNQIQGYVNQLKDIKDK